MLVKLLPDPTGSISLQIGLSGRTLHFRQLMKHPFFPPFFFFSLIVCMRGLASRLTGKKILSFNSCPNLSSDEERNWGKSAPGQPHPRGEGFLLSVSVMALAV